MIKVNGTEIKINHFPDNTQFFKVDSECISPIFIDWFYESDEELFSLICIVKHIKSYYKHSILLYMPYLPNARMDRVCDNTEVFTLKYFCEIINSLEFNAVYCTSVHSDVGKALLNNFHENVFDITRLKNLLSDDFDKIHLYLPDTGELKRCKFLNCFNSVIYGEKVRDWSTGKIQSLTIHNAPDTFDKENECVLILDDIISYGGTIYYSIEELKKKGLSNFYVFAPHIENSILDEEKSKLLAFLQDGTINRIFTTHSIFTKKHPKITILDE